MQTKSYTLDTIWPRLAAFGLFVALGLLIPALGWPQPITGPLVNALLLITTMTLGVGPAIALGSLTPLGGLLHGVLPLPLAVMTTFIMLGNATLVVVYIRLERVNRWLALGLAALAKFALLHAAVTLFVAQPVSLAGQSIAMPPAVVHAMSWPQLVTALAGGLIAFSLLNARKLISRG